jgi:hypothetical protein
LTITLIGFLFFPELTLIGFHRMMRQKKRAQKKKTSLGVLGC